MFYNNINKLHQSLKLFNLLSTKVPNLNKLKCIIFNAMYQLPMVRDRCRKKENINFNYLYKFTLNIIREKY